MFSSIHADDYTSWKGPILMNSYSLPTPDSPYGAVKVYMESLGRFYANKGVEVVCIRLGGVNADDKKHLEDEPGYEKVYLSHRDLTDLIIRCIEIDKIPGNYSLLYGISNNTNRYHDFSNSLGWAPLSNATD